MTAIEQQIQEALTRLSREHSIDIILAIESGSRAWGFPSRDSDYDVRIFYRHQLEWYLGVFEKPDTLTLPINGELDIGGWDIRKTLGLLHKGNAVVYEWLNSPIIYRSQPELLLPLQTFATGVFNPQAAFRHYFYMARNKLSGNEGPLTAKQFLYGMRTLLCARWVLAFNSAPPMAIEQLLQQFITEPALLEAIRSLILHKAAGLEADLSPLDNGLRQYALEQIHKLASQLNTPEDRRFDTMPFDCCFRSLIQLPAQQQTATNTSTNSAT